MSKVFLGSLTQNIKNNGLEGVVTARKINKVLEKEGIIKKRQCMSTKHVDQVRKYWEVVNPEYGVNTRTENTPPNRTEPVFYGDVFLGMLLKVGILQITNKAVS